jgi:hypothetical protein
MSFCYQVLLLVVLLPLGGWLIHVFESANRKKLLSEWDPPTRALPAPVPAQPPRVPTWDERMEAVGIRRAYLWEAMGGYLWEIGRDSNVYAEHAKPEMIGWLFVIGDEAARSHVDSMTDFDRKNRPVQVLGASIYACPEAHMSGFDILYEIAKAGVKDGVLASGRPELRFLGACCRACGAVPGKNRAESSQALGALWTEHRNLRGIVDALESPAAKLEFAKAKLACVDEEIEALDRRRNLLKAEQAALHAELGHGDPFRGLSPARLDDPPDDRAKSMPALKD